MARLLIDGYNLLLTSGRGADEEARRELCLDAARWRGGRALEVVIVFDSRAGGSPPSTPHPGVRVVFAAGEADRAILDLVRASPAPRDLLVVTSDRLLARHARDLGARTEDGASFRARLAERRARRARAQGEKPERAPSAREVEDWLRAFAARPEAPPDDEL